MFSLVWLGALAAPPGACDAARVPSTPVPRVAQSTAAVDVELRSCDDALAALDADHAEQRSAAEHWLTRRIALTDGPRVRAALAHATAECRGRLVNVLASASAGFELAVQLTLDADAEVARAGHAALVERLVRWSPGWAEPPATRGQVLARLNESPGELCTLDARRAEARVDLSIGVLARAAPELPPLVLAPGVSRTAGARVQRESLTGLTSALVSQLAREHGLTLAGFDFAEFGFEATRAPPANAHPWILFHSSETSPPPAAELVATWCTLAARTDTPHVLRRDATRALGACGSPDTLAWLAQRWSTSSAPRELAWLDGLLAAVDRGVVAPLLRDANEQRWLYTYAADPALEPRAELRRERCSAIARALAATGPRTADGGEAGAGVPLPADTDAIAQWVQFVAWEGHARIGVEKAAFLDARVAELGRGARPEYAPLLFQALRTRAATRAEHATPLTLERPEPAFEWGSRTDRVDEWTRALVRSGCVPPARWDAPDALPAEWNTALRASVLAWQLAAGKPAVSARHLAAFVERGLAKGVERELATGVERGLAKGVAQPHSADATPEVRARLFALRGLALDDTRDALANALAELATRAPFADAASWAVALDTGNAELAQRVTASCLAREPLDALAAAVLGARTARGDADARERLLRALAVPAESRAAAFGLEWAVEKLRDAADRAGESALVFAVRSAQRGGGADRTGLDGVTAGRAPVPRDLAARDRELPAELP